MSKEIVLINYVPEKAFVNYSSYQNGILRSSGSSNITITYAYYALTFESTETASMIHIVFNGVYELYKGEGITEVLNVFRISTNNLTLLTTAQQDITKLIRTLEKSYRDKFIFRSLTPHSNLKQYMIPGLTVDEEQTKDEIVYFLREKSMKTRSSANDLDVSKESWKRKGNNKDPRFKGRR